MEKISDVFKACRKISRGSQRNSRNTTIIKDRIGEVPSPHPITRYLAHLAAMPLDGLRSATVGAKRTSTGRSAPLPVGCPLVRARRSPSGLIAHIENADSFRLSRLHSLFIKTILYFSFDSTEIFCAFFRLHLRITISSAAISTTAIAASIPMKVLVILSRPASSGLSTV